jgi:hypothetical protein
VTFSFGDQVTSYRSVWELLFSVAFDVTVETSEVLLASGVQVAIQPEIVRFNWMLHFGGLRPSHHSNFRLVKLIRS